MPRHTVYLEAEWNDGRRARLRSAITVGELEEYALRYLPLRKPSDPRRQYIRLLRIRESVSDEPVLLLDALPRED